MLKYTMGLSLTTLALMMPKASFAFTPDATLKVATPSEIEEAGDYYIGQKGYYRQVSVGYRIKEGATVGNLPVDMSQTTFDAHAEWSTGSIDPWTRIAAGGKRKDIFIQLSRAAYHPGKEEIVEKTTAACLLSKKPELMIVARNRNDVLGTKYSITGMHTFTYVGTVAQRSIYGLRSGSPEESPIAILVKDNASGKYFDLTEYELSVNHFSDDPEDCSFEVAPRKE